MELIQVKILANIQLTMASSQFGIKRPKNMGNKKRL